MKKTILCIVLFIIPAAAALGCSCARQSLNDAYILSDFVGTVKITDTSEVPDSTAWPIYAADVEPRNIFKGETPSKIYVAGSVEGNTADGSCAIRVNPGEEWLVALRKNSRGEYMMNLCSAAGLLRNAAGESIGGEKAWQTAEHYQFLQQMVPGLHREYDIRETSSRLNSFLDQYEGQAFDSKEAHYLITFDSTLTVKHVDVLKGLGEAFDKAFVRFIKQKSQWGKRSPRYEKTPVKDGVQHVLGIYYDDEKQFLSRFEP